jgi:hypothetical protein
MSNWLFWLAALTWVLSLYDPLRDYVKVNLRMFGLFLLLVAALVR